MKRDYKFFLVLAGSLALSLSTLFCSRPAASEEAQILPPSETISSCLDQLPILEADKALTEPGVASAPSGHLSSNLSGNSSSIDSVAVVPQTVVKTDQIVQTSQTSESNQSFPISAPLTVPQIDPPPTSQPTLLVQPFDKSLPIVSSTPLNKLSVEALPESVIPASPPLPRTAVPISSSTEDLAPHTRYLPAPPAPPSSAANSVVIENKPTSLEPNALTDKPSERPTTVGCIPAVESVQSGVLIETINMDKPAQSSQNRDIEKSIENAQRSLKGFRPF